MREGAPAELCHFAGQEEIRSAPDGHGVEAGAAQLEAQRREDFLFVAEVSVGEQHDVTQIPGSLGLLHQMEERGKHLGAAASFEVLYETTSGREVFRGGSQWFRGKFIIVVVEGQDAEAIVRAEPVEGLKKCLSSLRDRGTGHRAGHVNHI